MSIGENVTRRREGLGLSLTALAHASNVSVAALHALENTPNVRTGAETLYKISTALECSMEFLMDVPRLPCRVSTKGNALATENLKLKKRLKRIADAIKETQTDETAAKQGAAPRPLRGG